MLRLRGEFNGLSVGMALNVKVALGDNSSEEICIDSPKGVLLWVNSNDSSPVIVGLVKLENMLVSILIVKSTLDHIGVG
tara:strand:- start:1 stop:237 length:237 start_codon:yes stop_codon:yes gene_type:complete